MKRTSIPAHPSNYHPSRLGGIRVIVIHTGETGEGSTAAEGMGNWFADPRARASAHKGADTDSVCTYLPDTATAWAAPGANSDGLQLELAGRAGQTSGEWADDASTAILTNGARVVTEWCVKHSIPPVWLTDAQLADGRSRGLVTHAQVSRVFKRSDHWDPGPNFPASRFLNLVTGRTPTQGDEFDMATLKDLEQVVRQHAGARVNDRVPLTKATAEAIGWGDRKDPTMSVGGLLQTSMRMAADAVAGTRRNRQELAKLADEIERRA